MARILGWLSRLVTARPYITLLILLLITVLLGAGAARRAPPPETAATLPQGSAVAEALQEISLLFQETGEASVVTLLFRGDAMTPEGLTQMDALITEIVSDPSVGGLLAPENPVVAPSGLVMALLQVGSFESVTQADIDGLQGPPEILGALDALTGADTDGTPVAIATIRLQDTGDERIEEAERKIDRLASEEQGPLRVSAVSPVVIEDAYKKATEEGMAPLVGLAFLLIAALILLFMRTISDLLLTLIGLLTAIIWIVGAEGWLGPNGLGLTGPPNSLTTMVPIIIIGLTVDYAIQIISHYREQRNTGEPVLAAVRTGFQNVTVPLLLAAVTTIVSLLASLFSPIEIVGDFGIIAGLGVGMSLVVMLTLVPAGRTIIDRRREARGTLRPPRPIANALPGVGHLAELLGTKHHPGAGSLLGGRDRGNHRPGLCGHGHQVGIQHPRHPAPGRLPAAGYEHPGCGGRGLHGNSHRAGESRDHGDSNAAEFARPDQRFPGRADAPRGGGRADPGLLRTAGAGLDRRLRRAPATSTTRSWQTCSKGLRPGYSLTRC